MAQDSLTIKLRKKYFRINVPIYKAIVVFLVNVKDENVPDVLVKLGICSKDYSKKLSVPIVEDIKQQTSATTIYYSEYGITVIKIYDKNLNTFEFLGIIAHEIYHAVSFILNNAGMVYNDSSEEAYSYLMEYLTTEFYKNVSSTK